MILNFFNNLFNLNRKFKKSIIISLDVFIILISLIISMNLRLDSYYFLNDQNFLISFLLIIPVCILSNLYFELYIPVIRFISGNFIKTIFKCTFVLSFLLIILSNISFFSIPRTVPFIFLILSFIMIGGLRVLIKLIYNNLNHKKRKNVAVFGAKREGRELLSILYQSSIYNPILFFEEDKTIIGSEINGLKVYSFKKNLNLLSKYKIETLLITSETPLSKIKKYIIDEPDNYPLEIKSVLDPSSLFDFSENSKLIKEVTIEDLLNRKPIKPDLELMKKNVFNKVIFVSGSGGSIGSEICREIINFSPRKIILFDHSEFLLYKIYEEIKSKPNFNHSKIIIQPILGSIQNYNLLDTTFKENQISIVFHAAAYKHVDLVEKNIFESVKNNILGTEFICNVSYKYNVKNFILVSSDKAVRPTNFMGATKRVSELICQSYKANVKKTKFSIVRFGNVMGSSGSVIPKFEEQIKTGGPLTVTNKTVTRFFMTIQEAAQLVIQSMSLAKGNDIFILDMGKPIKILELAKKMIFLKGFTPFLDENRENSTYKKRKNIKIKITGLKRGEKLYEELMFENHPIKTIHPRIFSVNEKNMLLPEYKKLIKELELCCIENDLVRLKDLLKHPYIQLNK
ncbi:MAG: nucleoside-diphosphate sugar epimerase [SAR116 cluster bacterium]|nr:nucleoside-diphosphate sugar epimerase [SAR116 cluster bacterium]RPH08563.1 MAG: polysaccharide biosynthesis protein [Alphaproteobacteria bacterium TMED54]